MSDKITTEQLIAALRHCFCGGLCFDCPVKGLKCCAEDLAMTAADRLEILQSQQERADRLAEQVKRLEEQVKTLKVENVLLKQHLRHAAESDADCDIMQRAIETYGVEMQSDVCIEEMAELMQAIIKTRRARDPATYKAAWRNLQEEIADVSIMIGQMSMMAGAEQVFQIRRDKLKRLKCRLEGESKNRHARGHAHTSQGRHVVFPRLSTDGDRISVETCRRAF